jgi:hypothetical protein
MAEESQDIQQPAATDSGALTSFDDPVISPGCDIRQDDRADLENDFDLIDWDVKIEVRPPRPSETMMVRFIEGGRRSVPLDEHED